MVIGLLLAAGVASGEAFQHQNTLVIFGLSPGETISFLSGFISLLLLVSIFHDYMGWKHERYEITTSRVVQWYGIFNQRMADVPLSKVGDVTIRQGFLATVFGYGTVAVYRSSGDEALSMRFMRNPQAFKRALLEAIHQPHEEAMPRSQPALSAPTGQPLPVSNSIQQSFQELAMLRDRGILSVDEFEMKKRELLSRI